MANLESNDEFEQIGRSEWLSLVERARYDYQAAHQLANQYFSSGSVIGSLIITLVTGLFAASVALVDKVLPLSNTDADPALFLAWGLLGTTLLLSIAHLFVGRLAWRDYQRYLILQAQALPVTSERAHETQTKANRLKDLADRRARWRDNLLVFSLLPLVLALGSLGSYVALGPTGDIIETAMPTGALVEPVQEPDEGTPTLRPAATVEPSALGGQTVERTPTVETTSLSPSPADVEFVKPRDSWPLDIRGVIIDDLFLHDPSPMNPGCIATFNLAFQGPSVMIATYLTLNGVLSVDSYIQRISGAGEVGNVVRACVPTPSDWFDIHDTEREAKLELFFDLNGERFDEVTIEKILQEVELSAEHIWKKPDTETPG